MQKNLSLIVLNMGLIGALALAVGCGDSPPPPPPCEDGSPPPCTDSGASERATRAIRLMKVNIDEVMQQTRAIEEAVRRNGYGDVGGHADRIVELTSAIRLASVDLCSDADMDYVREQLDRIQHTAHELEEEAGRRSHDGTHHALENLDVELDRLKDRVEEM